VGTHALLEKNVRFKNLGLIVVDEQHRFGVIQRSLLQLKSENPDVLVMTATPIPRTLALTIYGDMDVSTIDHLPPGRQPIQTLQCRPSEAYEVVKREVQKRNQAYIVFPLVEESDKIEMKAAVKEAKKLSATVFRSFRVGLVHGQMPPAQREEAMLKFRSHAYDILIATTVIEVGIDVPNATVIVIEHADRFGLATLHQLRGRVGRGAQKSFCILVGEPKTEEAAERMKAMQETTNGFAIAHKDLMIRGPGEFFGTAQSGILSLKAGNVATDGRLIERAKDLAKEIIDGDPELVWPEHQVLKDEVLRTYGKNFGLFKVG
jgi:ATP-dependent DNA helicase RecG